MAFFLILVDIATLEAVHYATTFGSRAIFDLPVKCNYIIVVHIRNVIFCYLSMFFRNHRDWHHVRH